MNEATSRLIITVVATAGLWALSFVESPAPRVSFFDPSDPAPAVTILNLGVRPLASGMLVVELFALLIPALRQRRISGWAARRPLRIAGVAMGLLFAAAQLLGLARAQGLEGAGAGLVFLGVLLAGGAMELVERWGLGSGYLVASLIVRDLASTLGSLGRMVADDLVTPGALLILLLGAGGTVAYLLWRIQRPISPSQSAPSLSVEGTERVRAPIPISGMGMSGSAAAVMSLPALVANLSGSPAPSWLLESRAVWVSVSLVLMVGFTVLWSLVFFRPKAVRAVWKRWNPSFDEASLELAARALLPTAIRDAILINVGFSMVVSIFQLPGDSLGLAVFPLALGVLDVVEEWRFCRAQGAVVRVWELHRTYEIDAVLRRLESEGLHPFAKNRHLRAAFQVFGPFIPVSILVPIAEATRAKELVGE